ncbi:dienelactone hydrolase [Crossiella equi]|uniref:Dienelactone hydrolase n=1 Tax=Crossiella equi TaxID=130796 RepID=A0ABS5AGA5_9PSEU|nr:hypothetical protein [Crossiella equi]MBP2475609.1 dienelactone hydrolase [Crossiella equi]
MRTPLRLVALAVAAAAACALPVPAAAAPSGVEVSDYTLGDRAFRFGDHDFEITGRVHSPRRPGRFPVVLLAHGLWDTCAGSTFAWPCPPGEPALRSQDGYDYLASDLAAQGMVVVSISVNGINAGPMGQEADRARAALANRHLALWQQLSATGGGELAGRFTESGRPKQVDFRGRVDLDRVGLVGHSRGGRGVAYQVADKHLGELPRGVRVRAAVPLAPAEYYAPDPEAPENLDYRITQVPFLAVSGTCDHSVSGGKDYFDNAAGRNTVPVRLLTLRGANHNFHNTEWSPASGRPHAHDDVDSNQARTTPGHCRDRAGASVRQLTEAEQHRATSVYLSAFFRRYLLGDRTADLVLSGAVKPVGAVAEIKTR